jgi:hypothetical protein
MKKLLAVLLSLTMIFIAVACTATPAATEPPKKPPSPKLPPLKRRKPPPKPKRRPKNPQWSPMCRSDSTSKTRRA